MSDLPRLGTIDRQTFLNILTDSEREAVREMMISHGINIGEVRSFDLRRRTVIYTLYTPNDDGHRYLDADTGEAAVRTVRHKIKVEVSDDS